MKRNLFGLLILIIVWGCSDTFTDPNPGYEEIIDNTPPIIDLITLKSDSVYTGSDSVRIVIDFSDDYWLDKIFFDLAPVSKAAESMSIQRTLDDSTFRLDTIYVKPSQIDTLELSVVAQCIDYANNYSSKSLTFKIAN